MENQIILNRCYRYQNPFNTYETAIERRKQTKKCLTVLWLSKIHSCASIETYIIADASKDLYIDLEIFFFLTYISSKRCNACLFSSGVVPEPARQGEAPQEGRWPPALEPVLQADEAGRGAGQQPQC